MTRPSSIDIESLLKSVSDTEPSGPNLEYDPEFLELERAVKIAEAEFPGRSDEWRRVIQIAQKLFRRTKEMSVLAS